MTGSSTSSSTWMLSILLLHFFISIQQSSSAIIHCGHLSEFNIIVDRWGDSVQKCRTKCNSAPITYKGCQCSNITVSPGGCSHPDYFIQGLKSLDPNETMAFASDLIRKLQTMDKHCKEHVTSLSLECDGDVITPVTLYEQLVTLKQKLNNRFNRQTQ